MAYINFKLNKNDAVKYKGYYYQKVNDKYYIFNPEGIGVGIRFSVKSCKDQINNYIQEGI